MELPDVLGGIQCAVTRKTLKDQIGPYLPDQAFTVQEAIDSFTTRSAEGSFEENFKGRIAPGMAADFVVLDQNLFEIPENAIKDVKVCGTYVAGKKVYQM